MNYYVIQVKTRGEEKYLQFARTLVKDIGVHIFWPRRNLTIRKEGRLHHTLAPIFPGYLFIEAETITPETYWQLKWIPGFFRILRDSKNIIPLSGEDKRLVLHFLSFGEIIHKSKVYFDENNRIRVLEGPLKGLEGRVVKVDRRKKRARVQLSLYEESFLVDFGFECLEKTGSEENGKDAHERTETEQQAERKQ